MKAVMSQPQVAFYNGTKVASDAATSDAVSTVVHRNGAKGLHLDRLALVFVSTAADA